MDKINVTSKKYVYANAAILVTNSVIFIFPSYLCFMLTISSSGIDIEKGET